jgi:hypothetical protein
VEGGNNAKTFDKGKTPLDPSTIANLSDIVSTSAQEINEEE